jgi:hypothetical protein
MERFEISVVDALNKSMIFEGRRVSQFRYFHSLSLLSRYVLASFSMSCTVLTGRFSAGLAIM